MSETFNTTCVLTSGVGGLILGAAAGVLGFIILSGLPQPPKGTPGENGEITMHVQDGVIQTNTIMYGGKTFQNRGGDETMEPASGPVMLIREHSIYCYYIVGGTMMRFGPFPDEYHCT